MSVISRFEVVVFVGGDGGVGRGVGALDMDWVARMRVDGPAGYPGVVSR
jgi:hypothetical protein